MAKISFTLDAWLKDKSQKVETRDGRLVHNIWRVKEPSYTNNRKTEVCALIDGEEDALVFFEGGRYLPSTKDTDSPFDLFIITPEPELSEFENRLAEIMDYTRCHKQNVSDEEIADDAKKLSKELLVLAIEEIGHKWTIRQESYQDGYINGLHDGKAEALKDLPRWSPNDVYPELNDVVIGSIGTDEHFFIHRGRIIHLESLEKLPGFND